jgi:hypothetical protein
MMPGIPAETIANEKSGLDICNSGAIRRTKAKRIKRSEIMAIRRINHTDKAVRIRNTETTTPTTVNSIIIIGKTGGAIGGMPVISHDIVGDRIVIRITYRKMRNILPTMIGINIGRNAGPKPRK